LTTAVPLETRAERLIGHVRSEEPGPTLIVCGGMHGDEPSGLRAARSVMARLTAGDIAVRGEVIALAGNLAAISRQQRFVEHDLNRSWTRERVAALLSRPASVDTTEQREQRDLLRRFEDAQRTARGDVVILDLHTTSSKSPPFGIFSDTLANRRVAMALGVPIVLGLEECLDGTLLDYATRVGLGALVIEGGRHDDPASERHHVAAVWQTLAALGCVDAERVPPEGCTVINGSAAAAGAPPVVEVLYRHPVHADDQFVMRPGFASYQRVRAGDLLARDALGPIIAREDGLLLLPLYQEQGEDGFFVVRPVRPFWLRVSDIARRMGLPGIVPRLPGVQRHPERHDWIVVHERVARFYTREVFHLLGFRTCATPGDTVIFARRRHRPEGDAHVA